MKIMTTGIVVRSKEAFRDLEKTFGQAVSVSAASFQFLRTRKEKMKSARTDRKKIEVFAASMADINKALAVKKYTDPKNKMPTHFH